MARIKVHECSARKQTWVEYVTCIYINGLDIEVLDLRLRERKYTGQMKNSVRFDEWWTCSKARKRSSS